MTFYKIFYKVVLFSLIALLITSCSDHTEPENEAVDINKTIAQEALHNFTIAHINTFRSNGITPEVMEKMISSGEFKDIENTIQNSEEISIARKELIDASREYLGNIETHEATENHPIFEEMKTWSKEQRLYVLNKFFSKAKPINHSKFGCKEPGFTGCMGVCLGGSIACMSGVGWTGFGAVGCLIAQLGCELVCIHTYCEDEGPQDPNCPPNWNCPIEQGSN